MAYALKQDSYDTKPQPRCALARWTGNSRAALFLCLVHNYYQLSKCARRGELDRSRRVYFSERNLRILESFGAQIHIRGLDHLRCEDGPYVLVGNHMSSVETALLNAMISPRLDFTYVVKRSLFKVPFLGAAMRAMDAIGVDRKNPREDFKIILDEGKKRLAAGQSVLIFPEATRQQQFKAENFNSIGTKLAKNAGVKVLPFALKTDFMTPGWLFSEFGPLHPENAIHFAFAAPMTVTGNGRDEHAAIVAFIADKTSEWQAMQQ
ncbi:MAG: lysophospholipid acyltransferase family protein [Lentisphaeria bacterium]|jgi:1-acyl-sn-glycerol-3-phosphate acyltransferase